MKNSVSVALSSKKVDSNRPCPTNPPPESPSLMSEAPSAGPLSSSPRKKAQRKTYGKDMVELRSCDDSDEECVRNEQSLDITDMGERADLGDMGDAKERRATYYWQSSTEHSSGDKDSLEILSRRIRPNTMSHKKASLSQGDFDSLICSSDNTDENPLSSTGSPFLLNTPLIKQSEFKTMRQLLRSTTRQEGASKF